MKRLLRSRVLFLETRYVNNNWVVLAVLMVFGLLLVDSHLLLVLIVACVNCCGFVGFIL